MGLNFTAIFSHNLNSVTAIEFCNRLNSKKEFPYIQKFLEVTKESDSKWMLEKDIVEPLQHFDLNGPGGLSILFGKKTCQLYHYTRWRTFVMNNGALNWRLELRKICFEIASKLKRSYVIYVPDSGSKSSGVSSMVDDGDDLETISKWLVDNCGAPLSSIETKSTNEEDTINNNGYYIDNFDSFLTN